MKLDKVTRIGKGKEGHIYAHIEYKDKRLSITGAIGPRPDGNAAGECGQIEDDILRRLSEYAPGWDRQKVDRFIEVWRKWHLNDMQAGCRHQRAQGWADERIDPAELPDSRANRDERGIMAIWVWPEEHPRGLLTKPCPECGYRYGESWLFEPVPQDVLDFLQGLPETDIRPAWI